MEAEVPIEIAVVIECIYERLYSVALRAFTCAMPNLTVRYGSEEVICYFKLCWIEMNLQITTDAYVALVSNDQLITSLFENIDAQSTADFWEDYAHRVAFSILDQASKNRLLLRVALIQIAEEVDDAIDTPALFGEHIISKIRENLWRMSFNI